MPCRTAHIIDDITGSPVKNRHRQSKRNKPIANGIVMIAIVIHTPKTKITTYAGICISFISIAVFAIERASRHLNTPMKKQAIPSATVNEQYKTKVATSNNPSS